MSRKGPEHNQNGSPLAIAMTNFEPPYGTKTKKMIETMP